MPIMQHARRLEQVAAQLDTPSSGTSAAPHLAAAGRPRAERCGGSGRPMIAATVPLVGIPEWAALERQLIHQMEQAVHPYLAKYTHPDGRLVYECGRGLLTQGSPGGRPLGLAIP
jgi:hypothetical protein